MKVVGFIRHMNDHHPPASGIFGYGLLFVEIYSGNNSVGGRPMYYLDISSTLL